MAKPNLYASEEKNVYVCQDYIRALEGARVIDLYGRELKFSSSVSEYVSDCLFLRLCLFMCEYSDTDQPLSVLFHSYLTSVTTRYDIKWSISF